MIQVISEKALCNKGSSVKQVGGLVTRIVSGFFWFLASCLLLQSHTEFNKLYEEIFSHVIPVCIIFP